MGSLSNLSPNLIFNACIYSIHPGVSYLSCFSWNFDAIVGFYPECKDAILIFASSGVSSYSSNWSHLYNQSPRFFLQNSGNSNLLNFDWINLLIYLRSNKRWNISRNLRANHCFQLQKQGSYLLHVFTLSLSDFLNFYILFLNLISEKTLQTASVVAL